MTKKNAKKVWINQEWIMYSYEWKEGVKQRQDSVMLYNFFDLFFANI
jgi:hypothetical protein